jgi:hypothetical protein
MGRTIPSFRYAMAMEKEDWKPFRNALDKSDRKKFDEMWDIPRLYTSACSYSVQPVRLYPILMSILLHHHKQLTRCMSEAERIEAKVNSKKKTGLMMTEEKEEEAMLMEDTQRLATEIEMLKVVLYLVYRNNRRS